MSSTTIETNNESLPTTIPTLEEQIKIVKNKLLNEFETISKSLNDIENQIKVNTTEPKITSIPIIDTEPTLQENHCLECIDYKEILIQGILRFIEKVIRFFVSFFSQITNILPIIFILYRISSIITPMKLQTTIKPIII